ncbi:Serine/threonine protein kinase PrkC, regulator of stationary phase [Anaerovibrio sp. JC8]|uniref:Stk1 family PASTA domain-containing Ser/Thr kinase n=1 Tax=Anaerovibrio sp. JC8 TaxID=1240085 RepID=UPI000A0B2C27|nr:Stk1 family PASTA domain-containing Ser/Thr kinase [Anaerovibrio sp. JC8]ORT99627.1 Serine/threonine protein kinase PrkC, regulator of stationary phase [Anaerovibrio sp. JC8]
MIERVLARRYEIQEHIGGGGMADVYRAHDKLLDRSVAVKILHAQFANDAEFIEKFHREAKGAAKLTHQNIVNIYDVGEDEGSHFIVMEYVAGHTLKEYIQENGCLEPVEAARIARELACALEAAHKNNLVHCDIKPHNILIMDDGHIKVTDFGIARAVSSSTMTYGGNVMGSVHYFSPEQAKGTAITTKSDVYSLGVVLYEMLTGTLPYNGETSVSIALKHLQEEPVPIRQIKPSVPAVLEAIVQKAMNKDPMLRPTSTDMYVDLDQALAMMQGKSGSVAVSTPAAADDPFATQVIPRVTPEMLQQNQSAQSYGGADYDYGYDDGYDEDLEDDEGSLKKLIKTKKFILGLVAILILGFFAGSFLSFGNFWSSVEVEVPDVVGRQVEIARDMLEEKNLRVKVAEAYDANVPAGQVVSQYPEAGIMVKEQRQVTIYISKGGEELTMPDLKGMSRSNAEAKLNKMGLKIGAVYEEESNEPAGTVLKQDPGNGSKVHKGQTVDFTVSKGPKKTGVTIPDYSGMSVDSVKSNLAANKLTLGTVKEQTSSQPKGTVIGQSPAAGSEVKEGGAVNIIVSSGQAAQAPAKPTDTGKKAQKTSPDEVVKP